MPVRKLKASPILAFERFSSFEEFRPNDVMGGGTSIPFYPKEVSVTRAALALPASRLVMQRSFARRLEAEMGAPGAALIIPLTSDGYAEINEQPISNSTLVLFRGTVPTRTIEPHANTYVMLRLHSEMQNRGWADFQRGFEIVPASPDRMMRLQSVLLNIAEFASTCTDARQFAHTADAMQDSLLAALDEVLVSQHAVRPSAGSYARHQKLVDRLDELIREAPAIPPHSEEMARNLGVSVRTLQTAVKAVHGDSLHHYLRLKRLWSARCYLSLAAPGLTVKAAARANGFWHMGEFSRQYRATFGEMPIETIRRSLHL